MRYYEDQPNTRSVPQSKEEVSTEDVPEDKEGYMKGLYAEVRSARRMAQHVFWVFLIYILGRIFELWS